MNTLYQHQKDLLSLNPPRYGLFWETGCLHPDTKIYDPVSGDSLCVKERTKNFHVWSINKNGKIVIAKALPSKKYTESNFISFCFSKGNSVSVTPNHRFWNGSSWIKAAQLLKQYPNGVFLLPTTLELSPSGLREDVQHYSQKHEDSKYDYRAYLRLCDLLLPKEKENVQDAFPQQAGVQKRYYVSSDSDGMENTPSYILSESFRHFSTKDFSFRKSKRTGFLPLSPKKEKDDKVYYVRDKTSSLVYLCLSLYYRVKLFFSFYLSNLFLSLTNSSTRIVFGKGELLKTTTEYYDFSVPEYENYFAEGVFHHNTGKSRTMVELAKKNVLSLRVVCPKALKENWRREIEKWEGGKYFSWDVKSKEEFRRDWDKLEPTEGLIIDEAHLGFGNHKSQMSKALIGYHKKHDTKYIWIATATPIMSTVWSVFSLAIHLGFKMDWYKYKSHFFYDVRMGARMIPVQRDGIEEEITTILQRIGGLVKLSECCDVPEQTFDTEYFKMTRQQQSAWETIDDATFISKWTKRHCIENGVLKGDGYTVDQTFPSDKTDRIIDLAGTNKKLAVICRYNIQIDTLRKVLEEEKKSVFVIRGDVKDRDAVVQSANACEDCVILIQADCSAGYELPTFHTIVFASLSFSYVNYKQMLGRFLRINKLEKNHYLHLVVDGGVDEGVYKAIMDKRDFYLEVFNGK